MKAAGILLVIAIAILATGAKAHAMPEFSAGPAFFPDGGYGPAPCGSCHGNNRRFKTNVFLDLLGADGKSLVGQDGQAYVNFRAGEGAELTLVTGLVRQDLKAKTAGWYFNLPDGAKPWPGYLKYGIARLNYEQGGGFTVDGMEFRVYTRIKVYFGVGMKAGKTEIWVGAGEKPSDKYPGSLERKNTLGLSRLLVNWAPQGE
ncbi:MAG: hypothetical protein OEZ04_12765 [Nitrospinota bacterium]|nr:hypothetical protein [Nitrospinota bacterium]